MAHTIVIFANSIKHGKHCIAGKLMGSKRWIRLVADKSGSELDHEDAKSTNPYGRYPAKPLQKIEMNIIEHVPLAHQPENYVSESGWVQKYKIEHNDLVNYLDFPETLWGLENRISAVNILIGNVVIEQSLYLVKVENLELLVDGTKRKARFSFNGNSYYLPVTDPSFDDLIAGTRTHHDYICVSLGEDYDGYHYKIVATIL